jgi:probable HAF family extracellular repeat protein
MSNQTGPLEPFFVQLRPLAIVAGLSTSVVACFGDTPQEPTGSTQGTPEFANVAIAADNVLDLGTFGGLSSEASGINSDGVIVGQSQTSSGEFHAFYWQNGTMIDMGTLGGRNSAASAVNNAGQIVGWANVGLIQDAYSAFLWQNGTMQALNEPGHCGDSFDPTAVNTVGQIVGVKYDGECFGQPGIWRNGAAIEVDGVRGGASDINENGQIVGWTERGYPHVVIQAALFQIGSTRELGTLGGERSRASAINGSGQIVGEAQLASGSTHAFLWHSGTMADLGTLGGSSSSATDINDVAQVVGVATTISGQTHAFWWQNGLMSDLGTLGGAITISGINRGGQVVGAASRTGFGSVHAIRWTIPTRNFWSVRHRFPPPRRAAALGVANNLLYAIGGLDATDKVLTTVNAYNPSIDNWSAKASLPSARQNGNGAATINGIMYLAGGQNAAGTLTRTLYAYNASTNSWSTKANMPAAGGCGGSAVIAGKLYVFSGCKLLSTGAQDAAGLLHRYNPSTNTWTTLPAAPVAHFQPAVAAIGGKLYVAGGNVAGAASRRLDVYDPATDTWTTKAAMPTARVAMASAVVGGKLYTMGGRSGTIYLDAVESYDPLSNAWSRRTAMISPRAGTGAGTIGQFIYVVGGRNATNVVAVNERYTP